MDNFTPDTDPFEEDRIPPWLAKQLADDVWMEEQAAKKEKILYVEGEMVGGFRFVRYTKFKNRATFACPECGRKFQYNIYGIKNKKRCKWYKFHKKNPSPPGPGKTDR